LRRQRRNESIRAYDRLSGHSQSDRYVLPGVAVKYRIEIWNSNQNQEERHYFINGPANQYLWGYNPELISLEAAEKIHNIIKIELNDGRSDR
jgi:hypothetical protein